jgi:hypothetical protein
MTKRIGKAAAGIFISISLGASAAQATYIRQFPPSLCGKVINPFPDENAEMLLSSDGQIVNTAPVGPNFFSALCPVDRDTVNPFINSETTALVNGWGQGNNTVVVHACRASATGGSIVCDPAVSASTGTGVFSFSWNPGTAWKAASINDSFYISLLMKGGTALFGYSVVD